MNQAEVPVLIIDDDTSFWRALERLLTSVGLPVKTFASALAELVRMVDKVRHKLEPPSL
jgi:FixJ family two-component response regulator